MSKRYPREYEEPVDDYLDEQGRHVVVMRKRKKRRRLKPHTVAMMIALALMAAALTVFLLIRLSDMDERQAMARSRRNRALAEKARAAER